MPKTEVRLFRKKSGEVPLLDWLDSLQDSVQTKCLRAMGRLEQLGFKLHVGSRKEAAYLEKGIYELRVRRGRVNYRMLYFFHGKVAIVISHGTTKEDRVKQKDINLALRHKQMHESDPTAHAVPMFD